MQNCSKFIKKKTGLYWILRILCSRIRIILLNAVICKNIFVILTWFFKALGCWPCQSSSKWPSESDLLKAITCCNVDTTFPIYNWHMVKLVKCGFLKISVNKLSLSCTVMDHRYQIYHFDAGRTIKWRPAYNWFYCFWLFQVSSLYVVSYSENTLSFILSNFHAFDWLSPKSHWLAIKLHWFILCKSKYFISQVINWFKRLKEETAGQSY